MTGAIMRPYKSPIPAFHLRRTSRGDDKRENGMTKESRNNWAQTKTEGKQIMQKIFFALTAALFIAMFTMQNLIA